MGQTGVVWWFEMLAHISMAFSKKQTGPGFVVERQRVLCGLRQRLKLAGKFAERARLAGSGAGFGRQQARDWLVILFNHNLVAGSQRFHPLAQPRPEITGGFNPVKPRWMF